MLVFLFFGLLTIIPGYPLWCLCSPSESAARLNGQTGLLTLIGSIWCGVLTVSCVSILLLILGLFTLPAVLICLFFITGIFICLGIEHALLVPPFFFQSGASRVSMKQGKQQLFLTLVAALVLIIAMLCTSPYEAYLVGGDASIYLNAGRLFQSKLALCVSDSLVQLMSSEEKAWFFQSLKKADEWLRFPGGFVFNQPSGSDYFPSFLHLTSLWNALFLFSGIDRADIYSGVVFGLLALATAFTVIRHFTDSAGGLWVLLLLGFNAIELFFSRYPSSEIIAQAWFLADFLFLLVYAHSKSRIMGWITGVLMGVSLISRFEMIVVLSSSLALFLLLRLLWHPEERWWGLITPFFFTAMLSLLYIRFFSNYQGLFFALMNKAWYIKTWLPWLPQSSQFWNHTLFITAWVGGGWWLIKAWHGTYYPRRGTKPNGTSQDSLPLAKQPHRPKNGFMYIIMVCAVAGGTLLFLGDYFLHQRLDLVVTLRWLNWYAGPLFLILVSILIVPLLGSMISSNDVSKHAFFSYALPGVLLFMANPQVELYQFWGVRRLVPQALPFLVMSLVLGVWLLSKLMKRALLRNLLFHGILCLCMISMLKTHNLLLNPRNSPFQGVYSQLEKVARSFPSDAVVLCERQLSGLQMATSMQFLFGIDSLQLPRDISELTDVKQFLHRLQQMKRPVFLLLRKRAAQEISLNELHFSCVNTPTISIRIPPRTILQPPITLVTYEYPLSIYRLR